MQYSLLILHSQHIKEIEHKMGSFQTHTDRTNAYPCCTHFMNNVTIKTSVIGVIPQIRVPVQYKSVTHLLNDLTQKLFTTYTSSRVVNYVCKSKLANDVLHFINQESKSYVEMNFTASYTGTCDISSLFCKQYFISLIPSPSRLQFLNSCSMQKMEAARPEKIVTRN